MKHPRAGTEAAAEPRPNAMRRAGPFVAVLFAASALAASAGSPAVSGAPSPGPAVGVSRTASRSHVLSGPGAGSLRTPIEAGRQATSLPALSAAPAYYRPIVVGGATFPLARSNFFALLRINQNWHAPRLRLIGGIWRLVGVHEGIDIAAERGTPILSMAAGTVESVGWTFYSGTRVGVSGSDGRYYFYAHLSSVAGGIEPGAEILPGTMLGRVGNTGYGPPGHRDEFPPHLHFGLEVGGEWVDPYGELTAAYDIAVRQHRAGQQALDALALAGDSKGWQDLASAVYADFDVRFGE
jgi:murein DD-endopeptidase MepM/ murein hydrolase activator NlpD